MGAISKVLIVWLTFKIICWGLMFDEAPSDGIYYIGNDMLIIGFIAVALTNMYIKYMRIFVWGCLFLASFELIIDCLYYIFGIGHVADGYFVIYSFLSFVIGLIFGKYGANYLEHKINT